MSTVPSPVGPATPAKLRELCRRVIYEADTPAGKAFDVALIVGILLSVLAVMLASVASVNVRWGAWLQGVEWFFTILFTLEYLIRLWCVESPARYARSFFGMVDLAAILPTYLSLLLPGSEYLIVIRSLRVIRVFRVLKLMLYLDQANVLRRALRASLPKILVFVLAILILVTIIGALIYLIEGEANGFTSIPISIYWAIVTLTTVGYGDISPKTPLGQMLASVVMILGYGIIAVPTGIVTAELSWWSRQSTNTRSCPNCSAEGHSDDARYCRHCGRALIEPPPPRA